MYSFHFTSISFIQNSFTYLHYLSFFLFFYFLSFPPFLEKMYNIVDSMIKIQFYKIKIVSRGVYCTINQRYLKGKNRVKRRKVREEVEVKREGKCSRQVKNHFEKN